MKELYHAHGILLRIGLTKARGGDYTQYFGENYKYIQSRDKQRYLRLGFEPWAKKYMTLRRFKQFLCAFRHQSKKPAVADKCYQLRMVCNTISAAAKKNFRPGRHNSFDEGGVGCRSRRCPIRQYNKDKPQKFRVDFFILSDADDYPILHVYLRECLNIGAVGTVRMNRKGMDKEIFNMKAGDERGKCKVYYDDVNKLLVVQWNDNKVVTILSTIDEMGKVDIKRRVGKDIQQFSTEKCIKYYQAKMGGVDNGDQLRMNAGGFKDSIKFKKWYKGIICGIYDFACLNASRAWAIRRRDDESLCPLTHHDFLMCLANGFLDWDYDNKERDNDVSSSIASTLPSHHKEDIHIPESIAQPKAVVTSTNGGNQKKRLVRNYCKICSIERTLMQMYELKDSKGEGSERDQKHLSYCRKCNAYAHTSKNASKRLIFQLGEFQNMSCFEILHSKECKGLYHMPSQCTNRIIINKSSPIMQRIDNLYKDTYGDPKITRKQLSEKRKQKRRDRAAAKAAVELEAIESDNDSQSDNDSS